MNEPIVKHSIKVSKLLKKKIDGGLLKQLRKKAFWHGILAKEDADIVFQMVGKMNRADGISRSFTFGTVPKTVRRDWVFLFDYDEPTALEFIETKIVRGKVPRSMLIKMVLGRLDKVNYREQVTVTRELLTPEGFQKAVAAHRMRLPNHYREGEVPWFLNEIEYLLSRDEMNQEIFDEAWDLWKVRGVMDA